SLKLTADTANNDIDNQGILDIESGNSAINSTTFTNSGVLTIRGTSGSNAQLTVANGFTNAGTITLDNASSVARNETLTVSSGTLFNSGVINTTSTGGGGGTITLNPDILSNTGTINVNESMNLTFATSATNEAGGNINIADTKTLDIDGGTFNNNGTITLLGNSSTTTLDLAGLTSLSNNSGASITGSGTIVNSGVITGPGTFSVSPGASPGILIFDGDLNTALDLEIELEGLTPATEHDQVVVNGRLDLSDSLMDVTLLNGYQPTTGDSFVVLEAQQLTGQLGHISGLDISSDVILDVGYINNSVILTALSTTYAGSFLAETIVGSGAQDVVTAGAGDDLIYTSTGADIIYGQDGNDHISVGTDFKRVDGGDGIDTLFVNSLTAETEGGIDNVEVISLNNGEDEDSYLNSAMIRQIVDGTNELTGIEDSLVLIAPQATSLSLQGDYVYASDVLLDAGRGFELFDVYTDATSTLLVSQEIDITLSPGLSLLSSDTIDLTNVEANSTLANANTQPELMSGTIDLTDLVITGVFNETEVNPLDNLIGSSGIADGSALQSTYAATDISAVDTSSLLESMLYNDPGDYHSFT
ncbi:MAG: hypothetical protein HOK91_09980, partial [Gammaproteobacteria bacterium]|nr:hypothetical protein [Gammaproteobacteria bacterium]